MKAIEHYLPVVLVIIIVLFMLYEVVVHCVTFESIDEILECD